MSYNVFGNKSSSRDDGNKTDTSLFVQKLYLRTNYTESNIEENIDLKKNNLELKIYHIVLVLEKQLQKIVLKINFTTQV